MFCWIARFKGHITLTAKVKCHIPHMIKVKGRIVIRPRSKPLFLQPLGHIIWKWPSHSVTVDNLDPDDVNPGDSSMRWRWPSVVHNDTQASYPTKGGSDHTYLIILRHLAATQFSNMPPLFNLFVTFFLYFRSFHVFSLENKLDVE